MDVVLPDRLLVSLYSSLTAVLVEMLKLSKLDFALRTKNKSKVIHKN